MSSRNETELLDEEYSTQVCFLFRHLNLRLLQASFQFQFLALQQRVALLVLLELDVQFRNLATQKDILILQRWFLNFQFGVPSFKEHHALLDFPGPRTQLRTVKTDRSNKRIHLVKSPLYTSFAETLSASALLARSFQSFLFSWKQTRYWPNKGTYRFRKRQDFADIVHSWKKKEEAKLCAINVCSDWAAYTTLGHQTRSKIF